MDGAAVRLEAAKAYQILGPDYWLQLGFDFALGMIQHLLRQRTAVAKAARAQFILLHGLPFRMEVLDYGSAVSRPSAVANNVCHVLCSLLDFPWARGDRVCTYSRDTSECKLHFNST